MLPAVDDKTGKILMKSKHELQLSPNGNGALFEAINTNKAVQKCIEAVDLVQVIGVDNVLNRLLDPVQVYFTASKQLDSSLKCLVKRSADEPIGVVCKKNGKYDVVEYSELSDALASKKAPGNSNALYFDLGNILMFMLNSQKLLKLCKDA